jgi:hypothetical protein
MIIRYSFLLLSCTIIFTANAQQVRRPVARPAATVANISPLSRYSKEWNDSKYLPCNTAKGVTYMSKKEKDVIYILNLIRTAPKLFAKTVYAVYPDYINRAYHQSGDGFDYYQTLMDTLLSMEPVNAMKPDNKCFQSAYCHASTSGTAGIVGHNRVNESCKTKAYFNGECIDYGNNDPLEILLHLLIDDGIPSLGHRNISISPYNTIGVSIQPHKVYRYCTVLDFKY